MSNSNNCDEFAELLDAYHDAELSGSDLKRVEEHLCSCKVCQNKLAQLTSLAAQLSSLPLVEPSCDIVGSMEFNFDFDFEPSFEFSGADSAMHGGERLDAYHDGELTKEESIQLERHIASCADCAQKLSQIDKIVRSIQRIPQITPKRDLVAELDFNCEPFIPLLDAYLDGELSSDEKTQVEQHISRCAVCSETLAKTANLISGLKSLPVLNPARDIVGTLNLPAEITASTVSIAPAESLSNKIVPMKKSAWAGLGAVAAAAAVLLFAVNQQVIVPSSTVANRPTTQHDQGPSLVADRSAPTEQTQVAATTLPVSSQLSEATNTDTSWPIDTKSNFVARAEQGANPRAKTSNAGPKSTTPQLTGAHSAFQEVPAPAAVASMQDTSFNELASLETNDGVADALGIATDEDGLYDIKI